MNQPVFRRTAIAVLMFALPVAVFADANGNVSLQANTAFNLDTGTIVSSGSDITWTGSSLTFQGTAKGGVIPIGTGAAAFSQVTLTILQALASAASTAPIPSSALPVGTVLGVETNGGNGSKLLVTANSGGTISLQYDTFESGTGGGGASGPTITSVMNNSSLIPSGFPNSGVTPSTLFVIKGSGLADPSAPVVNQDSTKGLPTQLNGASVTVTVNGVVTHPPIYHALASEIAAVLPASTPTGTGTVTVTYNNITSAAATIKVVPSALGFDVYNGSGLATDAVSYSLITYTNSAKPGEAITLWGTGLGADPSDSDSTYTSSPHSLPNVPLQLYVGGTLLPAANLLYQGATVYPGVTVIVLTLPTSVATGCYVSIAGVVGSVVSNVVTIPIAPNGGTCTDPELGVNGSQISSLGGQGTVSEGLVYVIQGTTPGTSGGTQVFTGAGATFEQITGAAYVSGGQASLGNCSLSQTIVTGTLPTITGLDAGSITVSGPSGSPVTLTSVLTGEYAAQLPSGAIPTSGGSFVFTGGGGSKVGSFTATVNFPNPLLSWQNEGTAATVTRSSGLNVTWSGGASGTYVVISGSSTSSGVSGSYTCIAPVGPGQFTVPPYVLLGLPAGTGTTTVGNNTNYGTFSASGINAGIAFGEVSFSVNSNYQ